MGRVVAGLSELELDMRYSAGLAAANGLQSRSLQPEWLMGSGSTNPSSADDWMARQTGAGLSLDTLHSTLYTVAVLVSMPVGL